MCPHFSIAFQPQRRENSLNGGATSAEIPRLDGQEGITAWKKQLRPDCRSLIMPSGFFSAITYLFIYPIQTRSAKCQRYGHCLTWLATSSTGTASLATVCYSSLTTAMQPVIFPGRLRPLTVMQKLTRLTASASWRSQKAEIMS